MTETLSSPPPDPPPPDARRLVRDPDDQVVAGVCAAFGRYTDTDPVLWRVTVGVLTLFGGAGLVLYALGWLLVPRRGERESVVERTLRRPDRGVSAGGVVLLVLAALVMVAIIDDGPGLGALLVIGGIAWLVARERRTPAPAAPVPSSAWGTEPGDDPWGAVPYGPVPPPPAYDPVAWPEAEAAPRRRRSALGVVTVSAAALVVGVLLALSAAGVDGLSAPRVVAAALLVVGAGLVVGTWFGRARWLLAVGLALVLLLGATTAARSVGVEDGVGERAWVPTGSSSYRLGAGEAQLDLTGLDLDRLDADDRVTVAARVGVGRLTVLVPEDVVARVVADAGLGAVALTDLDGDREVLSDGGSDGQRAAHEELVVGGPAGDATVELDLEVGMGEIEVRRVEA